MILAVCVWVRKCERTAQSSMQCMIRQAAAMEKLWCIHPGGRLSLHQGALLTHEGHRHSFYLWHISCAHGARPVRTRSESELIYCLFLGVKNVSGAPGWQVAWGEHSCAQFEINIVVNIGRAYISQRI